MGYETAPGTKMLATYCACCGKELLDADSVQAGMGPTCRQKHGVPNTLDDITRARANKLVYTIALDQFGPEVDKAIAELKTLGCDKLVKRIENRVYGKKRIVITVREDETATENRFNVASPYSDDFVYRVKKVRGRRWDGDNKVNHFPIEAWDRVWELIGDCYNGKLMIAPTGDHVINGKVLTREDIGLPEPNGKPVEEQPVAIRIERHAKWFAIYTPYDRDLVDEMRNVYGRRWSKQLRANVFPVEREDDVSEIVQRYFPKATFEIVAAD
jgi:hypothetical protein